MQLFSSHQASKSFSIVYDKTTSQCQDLISKFEANAPLPDEEISATKTGLGLPDDFHFGDYTWSILGKSEILLSELFANLKIGRSVSDVTQAVFSNPKLISVEKTADDWKLTSLKAFKTKETLTVTFSNGEELVIEVTDAPAGINFLLFYLRRLDS